MSHFIFMLTKDDRTVPNAVQVYSSLSRSPLRCVGFKDIGLPLDELKALARLIKADGRQVMLEVVSSSREAELRSVEAAIEIGVDHLLGGRHAEEATRLLKGSGIRYFPFAGHTRAASIPPSVCRPCARPGPGPSRSAVPSSMAASSASRCRSRSRPSCAYKAWWLDDCAHGGVRGLGQGFAGRCCERHCIAQDVLPGGAQPQQALRGCH